MSLILPPVRSIMDLCGDGMKVHSAPSQVSTFTPCFPIQSATEET